MNPVPNTLSMSAGRWARSGSSLDLLSNITDEVVEVLIRGKPRLQLGSKGDIVENKSGRTIAQRQQKMSKSSQVVGTLTKGCMQIDKQVDGRKLACLLLI